MTDRRRRNCMNCGRHDSECGEISWRGNCIECGLSRLEQSVYEQRDRKGPMYRRWQTNIIAGLERLLLDEQANVVQGDGHAG